VRVRTPRVDIAAGDGYDLLMSGVAVADADWRAVLSHGDAVRREVQAAGGTPLVRAAERFGRYGWINLCGLLAAEGAGGSRERLLDAVRGLDEAELHAVLIGVRRTRLTDQVPPETVRAAAGGDRSAGREVRRALSSAGMLLDVTPWLQRTRSRVVRESLEQALESWPTVGDARTRRAGLARARAIRRDEGGASLLRRVTNGIHYGPTDLDRVLLVSSALVEPILIWVDEPDRTIIVHPPLGDTGLTDAGDVLTAVGGAVGDETRIRLLRELRTGDRTLPDLCSALDRPRTTLLHHLALLRSAGLVTLTVSTGEPNVYRLDHRGFEALARAAKGFLLG
jgi:DNA-binding transcriptional ArsR family regulator